MLTPTSRGRRDRKRLAGVAVVAATITALSAGAASTQEGAPGFEIKDELAEVKAEGPGFETKLSPDGLRVEISDESFGFPGAGSERSALADSDGGDPRPGWAGSPGGHGSRGRHDDVLDLRHVAVGGRRGLAGAASALPGVHVGRVPVPPVVRRGDPLVPVVTFSRLVQQRSESRDGHRLHPPRDPLGDFLQDPLVAVGV